MTPALEAAEIAALRTIFSSLGAIVVDVGGWTVLSRPDRPGHPWMHQVLARGEVGEDDLDEALALAGPTAQVQVPGGVVLGGVVPAGVRADGVRVDELLVARGLVARPRLVRLVRGVPPAQDPPAASELVLRPVGPEGARDVQTVGLAGFDVGEPDWWSAPLGAPGWTQVVAYDGVVPVATGALHVSGPVAWVGAAATVPDYRGRGGQTALLARRRQLAAASGATRVVSKVDPGGGGPSATCCKPGSSGRTTSCSGGTPSSRPLLVSHGPADQSYGAGPRCSG